MARWRLSIKTYQGRTQRWKHHYVSLHSDDGRIVEVIRKITGEEAKELSAYEPDFAWSTGYETGRFTEKADAVSAGEYAFKHVKADGDVLDESRTAIDKAPGSTYSELVLARKGPGWRLVE